MKIILYGKPITKKNSGRIITNGKRPFLLPSKQFVNYEKDCKRQITGKYRVGIDYPVNLKALYYMPTRHRVDLTNLLNATNDILVDCNVLEDDNSRIVVSHDGSRVLYDKENPRTEIYIEKIEEEEKENFE